MRIAIVGAGRIGGDAARLWSRAGHDMVIRLSRYPDQLAARAGELGGHASAASPEEYRLPKPKPSPKPYAKATRSHLPPTTDDTEATSTTAATPLRELRQAPHSTRRSAP